MKEQAIQKINKVGKISTIVTIICKILVILGLITCIAGAVICMVVPKELVKVTVAETMTTEVNYGSLGMEIAEDEIEQMEQMRDWLSEGGEVQIETVRNGVISGSMSVISTGETYFPTDISIVDGVVKADMTSDDVTFTLRDVAGLILVAIIGLVMTMVTLIFVEALCKAFRDCQSPFEENVIKKMQRLAYVLIPWTFTSSVTDSVITSFRSSSIHWSFSLNMGVVLVVLIVLVLVYIFKYGAVLQQESDETL